MHFGLHVPQLGAFAEPRELVDLAVRAEAAGWDGFFLWDHLVWTGHPSACDPWVALGAIAGYAWRGGNGVYRYVETGPPTVATGDIAVCNGALIHTLTADNAKVIKITPAMTDTASVGTPIFLFRRIKYEFKASTAVPGMRGLFRTVMETGASEELAAPFDNNSKFRFFIGNGLVAQDAPPGDLSTLRGIELVMNGMSERIPSGSTQKALAPFTTAVYFKNRLD